MAYLTHGTKRRPRWKGLTLAGWVLVLLVDAILWGVIGFGAYLIWRFFT